jgi:hypothetical protein
MTDERFARRATELAQMMADAAARLPRDWPKELRPADPAAEATGRMGETKDE